MKKFDQMLETVLAIKILLEKLCACAVPVLENGSFLPTKIETDIGYEKPLDSIEVQEYLRISRPTYYRYVQQGILEPRVVGSRHWYYKADLRKALELSRRKGRF